MSSRPVVRGPVSSAILPRLELLHAAGSIRRARWCSQASVISTIGASCSTLADELNLRYTTTHGLTVPISRSPLAALRSSRLVEPPGRPMRQG